MTCWRVTSETAMIAAARRRTRDEEPVAQPVDEAGSPGHHVPVQPVADPHGGTPGHERNGVFGVEQDVDPVPTTAGGTATGPRSRTERAGQGHLLDRRSPVGADERRDSDTEK